MRIYLFGIPGDRHYLGEFRARLGLISRILEDEGYGVCNAFEAFEQGVPEAYEYIELDNDGKKQRRYINRNGKEDDDALVFEVSTEINPQATVGLLSDLTQGIDKPVRILRALFFKEQSIDSRNGRDAFLQKFLFREGQRLFIYYTYNSDPEGYNDSKNNELKRHLRDLGREQISREHEVTVLAGIGTERRV